ncbi:hypothetical protein B0H67DRAFT_550249 [Lasiosphaeris hirsuta]|uniref:Apple domain-containing protein n=1 Tax=Lasiosphaeris hirsuta TaxID=260670 RepID=A0AA40E2D9_9PEZI|nr:hypothetical protein B0H67DRAFT_550249 [Lasiosphaeris hirsuta]
MLVTTTHPFVMLLLAARSAMSVGREYLIMCGQEYIDLGHGNLAKSEQPDYEHCAQFCERAPRCITFSYVTGWYPIHNCYLKNFTKPARTNNKRASGEAPIKIPCRGSCRVCFQVQEYAPGPQ